MDNLNVFKNDSLNLKVRTLLNDDGSISINAENTAIGFGWIQIQLKNNKEYISIRWETLNNYCNDLGFPNKLGKDDYIPESLFYLLGMKANNKIALDFQRWLATEVLPSIRKNGGYILGQSEMTDEELMAKAVLVSQKIIESKNLIIKQQQEKLEEQAPSVEFAKAVNEIDDCILIGQLAKLIAQNGVNIGEKRLFKYLRDNGYLINRIGSDRNTPTQKAIQLGVLKAKETVIDNPIIGSVIKATPVVTGKGQLYFIKKFKSMIEESKEGQMCYLN